MTAIPQQNPVGDTFSGSIIQVNEAQALTVNDSAASHIIAAGTFVIRHGLRFLGKLHISILPGLLVLDYGEMMSGEEAWEFLLKRSNLYPRSEVVGYKNDGAEDMVFIRSLDMAVPPEVLAFADANSSKPIAKPTALIASESYGLADRLLHYLPRYPSLAAWQAEMKS